MTTAEFTITIGEDGSGTTVPAAGTLVALEGDSPHPGRAYTLTDGDGTVIFEGLSGSSATLLIGGYRAGSQDISSDLTKTISGPVGIFGVVKDAGTGEPLAGKRVVASQESHAFEVFTETSEEGRYTIPIPGGETLLYADGGSRNEFVEGEDIILDGAVNTPGVSGGHKTVAFGFSQTVEQDIAVVRE